MKHAKKQVLVTGGTSGLGQAIAEGFANANCQVLAVGLGDLPQDKENISYRHLDVTDLDAVISLIDTLSSLDVVVNAAGVIRREEELSPDVFAQVVDINLNGTMRVCAAARPLLADRNGSIINIASMLSYFGGGLVPGYAASKGGIAQLTKSLAIAYASDNIRVNALAPGWISTPLTQNLQDDAERSAAILSRTPMARWGQPEDLIGPALFLASEAAGFVTGTILNVDGGYAAV
ncbi:SDR family NAD(P)-dependent oxidoreductase [Curvivirga sp.]|uniref:SDR family NAD(P)-dependent oxidoreductase n=1 Tax=Curvivirga sp. TaxID=2856848 RepID=UPI003B58BC52